MALSNPDFLHGRITFESNERALVIRAMLPGIDPERLRIMAHNDLLTIAGDTQPPLARAMQARDNNPTARRGFCQSLRLPSPIRIDHAQAEFLDGVLTLTLPHPGSVARRQSHRAAAADLPPPAPDAA